MKINLELPDLPFQKDVLVPIITEDAFDYHYGKHYAAHVNNLKGIVKDPVLEEKTVKEIISEGHK